MSPVRLIAVLAAVLMMSAGCAGKAEHDASGRLVLSNDFNDAITSSNEPAVALADVILNGTLPADTDVEGLPKEPTGRLGFFLTEVTSLPGDLALGDLMAVDGEIQPLVIPALAEAKNPMPDSEMPGISDVLLKMAPELRASLRDGGEAERSKTLDALANVWGDNDDTSAIDSFERELEDAMQEAIEEEVGALGPRSSASEVDQVVTNLGRDWITPTAQAIGASYRMFCQNRPNDCDGGAFEGRVDLFQRQSLVPLFTNLPESALPAALREPYLLTDYPGRDSDQEEVWTKYLLEHDLSPLTDLYEAAEREPTGGS